MPKQDGFIASVSLDAVANGPTVQFIRWQVHGDWVQQVRSVLTACLTGGGVASGSATVHASLEFFKVMLTSVGWILPLFHCPYFEVLLR